MNKKSGIGHQYLKKSVPEAFLETEPERIGTGLNRFEWVKFKEYSLTGQILFVYSRPFQTGAYS